MSDPYTVDPRLPTSFGPGTPEKQILLQRRVELRMPLAIPGDSQERSQYVVFAERAAKAGLRTQPDANGNLRLAPPLPPKKPLTPEQIERARKSREREKQKARERKKRLQARWTKASKSLNAPLNLAKKTQRAASAALEAAQSSATSSGRSP